VTPAAATAPRSALRAQFDRDGFICPLPALSPERTAHYRAHYLDFQASHQAQLDALSPSRRWQNFADTHFVLPWVDALTRESGE